jgi:hypothetical protein
VPATVRTHGPTPRRGAGRAASWDGVRSVAAPLGAGALAAAAVLVVARVDPHQAGSYGVCPLLALTGLYCAGCGGLRATYDLAHGDLAGAWAMNPVWVLLVPVLVLTWVLWLARRWDAPPVLDTDPHRAAGPYGVLVGPAPAPRRGAPAWLPWGVLAFVLAYSAARNVPVLAPWLAP